MTTNPTANPAATAPRDADPLLDATDRRILRELDRVPRATVAHLAERLNLARGTVQARIRRLYDGVLLPETTKVPAAAVGRPLRAFVTAEIDQARFEGLIDEIARIPEVVGCLGISGESDLQIEVIAVDADDVYRITQALMECRGIRRTSTAIVLRELLGRRMHQLL